MGVLIVFAAWTANSYVQAANNDDPGVAIMLLKVTILKAFLHDLSILVGLYRIASCVGLALSLALVAVALLNKPCVCPGRRWRP